MRGDEKDPGSDKASSALELLDDLLTTVPDVHLQHGAQMQPLTILPSPPCYSSRPMNICHKDILLSEEIFQTDIWKSERRYLRSLFNHKGTPLLRKSERRYLRSLFQIFYIMAEII